MPSPLKPEYLLLYADCVPVRGVRRTAICDLKKRECLLIPHVYAEWIPGVQGIPVEAYAGDSESAETGRAVRDLLLARGMAFLTRFPERFAAEVPVPETSSILTHCILDMDCESRFLDAGLLAELDTLGVQAVTLRFQAGMGEQDYAAVLAQFAYSRVRSIACRVQGPSAVTFWQNQAAVHARLLSVHIYGGDADSAIRASQAEIHVHAGMAAPDLHCGAVGTEWMNFHPRFFHTARRYNSCLYGKLSIDTRGALRTCPASPQVYGYAGRDAVATVVCSPRFQAGWQVNKDAVEVCRVCEFRYICPDCRVYSAGEKGKPLRCGYEPYGEGG